MGWRVSEEKNSPIAVEAAASAGEPEEGGGEGAEVEAHEQRHRGHHRQRQQQRQRHDDQHAEVLAQHQRDVADRRGAPQREGVVTRLVGERAHRQQRRHHAEHHRRRRQEARREEPGQPRRVIGQRELRLHGQPALELAQEQEAEQRGQHRQDHPQLRRAQQARAFVADDGADHARAPADLPTSSLPPTPAASVARAAPLAPGRLAAGQTLEQCIELGRGRRVLGHHPPLVHQRDAVAELARLVRQVRRQHHAAAAGRRRRRCRPGCRPGAGRARCPARRAAARPARGPVPGPGRRAGGTPWTARRRGRRRTSPRSQRAMTRSSASCSAAPRSRRRRPANVR